ncbi:MAG: radical SAM protein [Polyangiaceae bacterium]
MRILLVGAELEENLALRSLAAVLEPAGHTVTLAGFAKAADADAVLAAVRATTPDLIGMSMTFQFRAQEFGELAATLRDSGFSGHITVGGHFPTFAYREVLSSFPAIDTVVRHEGEITLPELCAEIDKPQAQRDLASIRGLVFRADDGGVVCNEARPLIEDLDALPFAKRVGDPQLHLGIPAAFLVGSRGCYGHCTFCCIHAYLKSAGGPKYRMRSAENIADEMAELRRKRGARMFVFHDDDFFTRDAAHDLTRMTALRDALKARAVNDIAVVVKARPDDVDDRVFSVLKEIGLLRVYLGIESGSTEGLRVLGRGVDLAQNRRALDYLKEHDVYTCYNMLVFDPESTIQGLRQSFDFVRRNASVPMNFCRTEIYVGTPLMTKLAREERLIGDAFGWDYVIREPAAERAFRIFANAFLDRNFRCDGLMNANLGLGYNLHLLREFYPRALTDSLRERVDATVRKVNVDCMDRMGKILDFAASTRSEDRSALHDFTMRTMEEVNAANGPLEDEVATVNHEIYRAAFSPPSPRPRQIQAPARPKWQVAAVALVPLAAGMEGCSASPPPPDPLPEPIVIGEPDGGTTTTPMVDQPVDPPPPPFTAQPDYPPPPDPLPPPTTTKQMPPNDVLPPPTGKKPPPPPPPPDPLPPPTWKGPPPPPPDPLPPPTTKKKPLPPPPPPPDPLPSPQWKTGTSDFGALPKK